MDTTYKLIGTKLYVVQTQEAEVIDFEDISEATLIYIQPELLDSYKVLNPDYSALMKPYSYTVISSKAPAWKDEPGPGPEPPTPVEEQYLTFEVVTAGTVTIKATNDNISKTISYSTDDGTTWTNLTTSTTEQSFGTFAIGDKVLVKGNNTEMSSNLPQYNKFGGTAQSKVYGNIMSLVYGDNFKEQTSLSKTYTFYGLFYGYTNLKSAENLILPSTSLTLQCYGEMFRGCTSLTKAPELPATTLAASCYQQMFNGCTSLTKAPELPATTLAQYCYYNMFEGCSSLNYVKCLATDISATDCLNSWMHGVSATGTFITADNAPAYPEGASGIPTGWTVETVPTPEEPTE